MPQDNNNPDNSSPSPYSIGALIKMLEDSFARSNNLKLVSLLSFLLKEQIYEPTLWDYINSEFIKNPDFEPYKYMPVVVPSPLPSGTIIKYQNLIMPSNIPESDKPPVNQRPIGALNPFAFDFSAYSHKNIEAELVSLMEKESLESTLGSASNPPLVSIKI